MDKLQGRTISMCKGSKEYHLYNGTLNLAWNGPIIEHELDHRIWNVCSGPHSDRVCYDDAAALAKRLLAFCLEYELDTIRLEVFEPVFTTKGTRIEPVQIHTYHLTLGETTYKASDDTIVRNVVDKFLA